MIADATCVIFRSMRNSADDEGYAEMAVRMETLAAEQPGFLGMFGARDGQTRVGITVSLWRDDASARAWKAVAEHVVAQEQGQSTWYSAYEVIVARVTRSYSFTAAEAR